MKLSDISNQQLAPGRYLITASYDGNDEYNPTEAQLILVIDESGEAHYETEPVDDQGAPPKILQSPNVSFNPSTLNVVEKNVAYPFDWHPYFSNPFNVGYNVYVSDGLALDQNECISWDLSGTYTLVLTTQATDVYEQQTIQLTLNVTAKTNPQIEYVNDGNVFTLENGNFVKRYYNIEKREGVYMFDLIQPKNPFNLPLHYVINDVKHGTIDEDDNKVYISQEGKYYITAYYEGSDIFRHSITSYILKYYEGEEPEDEGEISNRVSPNLSFPESKITINKSDNNNYTGVPANNPYGVEGKYVVSKGSITLDGTTITYDGVGSVIVSYIFGGNDKYLPQSISYILNIYSENNPDQLPLPDIGFTQPIVTVEENEAHEYPIQLAYNNSGVAINYFYDNQPITDNVLKTNNIGTLTIVGVSEDNGTFAATTISYKLVINKHDQVDPNISFDSAAVTEYQSDSYEYLLQFVNNPNNVELIWTSSMGVISDNMLYCEDLGTVIITVKNKPNFYYYESTISYTLTIEESPKLSPELSFDEEAQFFNLTDTHQYQVQPVNNPHNVELRWFSDRGELNSEMNPTYLTITSYSGPVNIYCKSVEDDTYKSEVVSYKLYVGAAKKYLQYTKHADYVLERNQGTFDLEMLRYTKAQGLEFDPTEWTFTSSLPSYCTVNSKYYTEDGDYIVVMVNLTINRQCNPLISVTFKGNENFYSSSNIRVHVNLVGKNLLSPQISFSNSYVVVEQAADDKYILQPVNNPYDVDIVYTASAGSVDGNVLTYTEMFNIIVKATSVETDVYASETIQYKMEIKPVEKPSSGIHFPLEEVTITQTNEGVYQLQGIVDAEDNPISYDNLPGEYSSSSLGDVAYNDSLGCYTLTRPNWYGVVYVYFTIYETQTYRKEKISYKLNIESNVKPSPNLAFAEYQITVTQNSSNTYPVQALINPNNVPVTWFCSKGTFDDNDNPTTITYENREYIRIGVRSEETETYKAQEQAYGMSIMLPSKKDPGLSFDKYDIWTEEHEDGIYTMQYANNPNNVEPLTYSISKGSITDGHIVYKGIGELTITVSYPGDDVYNSVNLRYMLHISGAHKDYLDVEKCEGVEMTGELNEDFDVQLVRWSNEKNYTFNAANWTVTPSHYRCTFKGMHTEDINGYTYLVGTFSFKSSGTAYITTSFKGDDDFYNDEGHGLWIEYTEPVVIDTRPIPNISFNNYMLYMDEAENDMYLLQSLNKPADVEIDRWELDYGGDDFASAKIIDGQYVYYEGTDYVHVKVYTKESETYKATSDGYSLYINVKSKTGTSIYFIWDTINAKRTTDGVYDIQSVHISPENLPVVWTTSKGTLTDNNTKLSCQDTGEVTITCSFAGNDDYESSTASYKLIISNEYVKKNLEAEKYYDQHLDDIEYNTEYDIPLIKWALSENLEYEPTQWTFTGDNSSKWNLVYLFTSDDTTYRTLYAKMTFNQNGNTYYTLNFVNNPYYYDTKWQAEIYFNKPEQGLISPQISWPEPHPADVERRQDGKYLIQTPISEYDDVEFNAPYSGKTVIEENGQYYISYSGVGEVNVYVSNKLTDKYYQHTISYTFKIVAPQTLPDAPISFAVSQLDRKRSLENTYQPQTLSNPQNLTVRWESNLGTIDATTGVLTYDGTGGVIIKAIFDGDSTYSYTEATYTLNILQSVQKKYLEVSKYADQNIEVTLDQDVDIPLIKWDPTTQNLDYIASEWTISNTYTNKAAYQSMHTVDEDGYRTLYATFKFKTSGTTQIALKFKGNDYYYEVNSPWRVNVEFYRPPEIELIDPKISWPESEETFEEAEQYLIQTPISDYNDVQFNQPTVSRGILVEQSGSYYVQATGLNDIVVTISNLSNNVYEVKEISYTIKLTEQIIVKQDSEIAFSNATETVDYIWRIGQKKIYKVQSLYNPYNITVSFSVSNGNLLKIDETSIESNGYIDYGYYIETDYVGDITITVTGQENDLYTVSSSPQYTMTIDRNGIPVVMQFDSTTVEQQQTKNHQYKVQKPVITPYAAQIADNLVYTVNNKSAILFENAGLLYISYDNLGTLTVKATFNGDSTYAPTEATYDLVITEYIKPAAPVVFPENDIYTSKGYFDIYPLQMPQSTDGNTYNYVWMLPSGWNIVESQSISPDLPITDDTNVVITCVIAETEDYAQTTIQYTLHILTEHKPHLNATVHNDYNMTVSRGTTQKLELMRWPTSQNYTFDTTDWRFRLTYSQNGSYTTRDISENITCEQNSGYNVIYYTVEVNSGTAPTVGFGIDYTVEMMFVGTDDFDMDNFGLYMRFTELNPVTTKKNPNVSFANNINNYTINDGDTTCLLPEPTIVYDNQTQQYNYPISYYYVVYDAIPNVIDPQSYQDFTRTGDAVETSEREMSIGSTDYMMVYCVTNENAQFYSKTVITMLHIIRPANMVDPTISLSTNSVKVNNIQSQSTFTAPTVTNTSNVQYKWYINDNEITVSNGQFTYTPTSDSFVLKLVTTETNTYNSITLYCNYINNAVSGYEWEPLTIESLADNNRIMASVDNWTNGVQMRYSTDNVNWNTIILHSPSNVITTLQNGQKVYLKCQDANLYRIFSDDSFNVSGNIYSIINGDNFGASNNYQQNTPIKPLFEYSYVVSAKNLKLIAKSVCDYCYQNFFGDCYRLTEAPELPATSLGYQCYAHMFENCYSLTKAPKLPATTLKMYCYQGMFKCCLSLKKAPELPATTLVQGCYYEMFMNCSKLNYVKVYAVTASREYPEDTYNWLYDTSKTGTFVQAANNSIWYSPSYHGIPANWTEQIV